MEAIVNIAAAVGARVVLFDDREEGGVTTCLRGERDDGGVSTSQGGAGSGKPVITCRSIVLSQVNV